MKLNHVSVTFPHFSISYMVVLRTTFFFARRRNFPELLIEWKNRSINITNVISSVAWQ